jgi:hypothetical protein
MDKGRKFALRLTGPRPAAAVCDRPGTALAERRYRSVSKSKKGTGNACSPRFYNCTSQGTVCSTLC